MTTKINFTDVQSTSFAIESNWKFASGKKSQAETQTPPEFYKFNEIETQTGIFTEIVQDQVKKKNAGATLLDRMSHKHPGRSTEEWKTSIESGHVTVDCEVSTDPAMKMEEDFFIEFVNMKCDSEVQTSGTSQEFDSQSFGSPNLAAFLTKNLAIIEEELSVNLNSKAFDGYELMENDVVEEISFWRLLTADLEKKKVLFPDWSSAKHCLGRITKCVLTRNKERVYDIDYDDGIKLFGVREEHIRLLEESRGKSKASRSEKKANIRLQEGVRVHAKVTFKGGIVKYLPGRVVKCNRSGTFDVECEGGRMESGIPIEDIVSGLEEGELVEARRPSKVQLQCTGVSWNSTGSTIAAAYGRSDVVGWCDLPGALCLWNVFGKSFSADNPDFVLDHTSCLTCVRAHPVLPAIVAAGSFNGEVVVWDLTAPEQPLAVSQIFEYAHKEPVMDIDWARDGSGGGRESERGWLLATVGADGKVLFWSLTNGLKYPIRGATLAVPGRGGKSSRRQYPLCHGATSLGFTGGQGGARSKWVVVGQEGGSLIRGQASRLISGTALTKESFRSLPPLDEVYPPLKRGDELFAHDPHVGPVNTLDCSPFHRNLFLSGGGDGCVKLFHVLEKSPLAQWEPVPLPGTPGVTGTFSAITCVRFSPIRPLVFAAGSADGFVFLFDLLKSSAGPVAVLEALTAVGRDGAAAGVGSAGAGATRPGDARSKIQQGTSKRLGITSIAFNRKQRDLLAGCDVGGRVHIWRLSWSLSNRGQSEQALLDALANSVDKDGD